MSSRTEHRCVQTQASGVIVRAGAESGAWVEGNFKLEFTPGVGPAPGHRFTIAERWSGL